MRSSHLKEGEQRAVLLPLLKRREVQLSSLDEKYWTVIGQGSLGDKAEELRRKSWALEQVGFSLNPRVALSMGFFEGFRSRNFINRAFEAGAPPHALRKHVRKAAFDENEMHVFDSIMESFRGTPIAIRSSAHGDSRGTGIYESVFCPNSGSDKQNFTDLLRAVRKVLVSEFSDSAIAFRKDLGLKSGMALIIEPVFGQKSKGVYSDSEYFGPLYGGAAYSSTSSGPGYTILCAGMPIGAVSGKGVKVSEGDDSEIREIVVSRTGFSGRGRSARDMQNFRQIGEWISRGEAFDLTENYLSEIEIPPNAVECSDLSFLFDKLRKLEFLIGKPQYLEWAATEQDGKILLCPLQVADVNPKADFYEFSETGRSIIKSEFVNGSGQIECESIVAVVNPDGVRQLREYNSTHKNYAVIYRGDFVSSGFSRILEYSDLNNASVLIEISNVIHTMSPAEHFKGLLDSAGKILMVAEHIEWDALSRHEIDADGADSFYVYPLKVSVTASERQQKAIVELVE